MSQRPFRFLHASDLHLERGLFGVAEVPEHLRDLFLDARRLAAQRVFNAALSRQVDFVVLAGDIVLPQRCGPAALLAFVEQCERLAAVAVGVYCALPARERIGGWPEAIRLPSNVRVFSRREPEACLAESGGWSLARIVGTACDARATFSPAEFHPDAGGLFTIGVAHGRPADLALSARGIGYWALGGGHRRGTHYFDGGVAHDPGTPQGHSPGEPSPHGCTLVEVDVQGRSRLSFLPTDVARWHDEQITIGDGTTRVELERLLSDRVAAIAEAAPEQDHLVRWRLLGAGPLMNRTRRQALGIELLGWLREVFGRDRPAVWSVSLDVEPPAALPAEWLEQQSLRGDFLRAIRGYQTDPSAILDLDRLAPAKPSDELNSRIRLDDGARNRVLMHAAMLGGDLLEGEEPGP